MGFPTLLFLIAISARGQSLVEPERVAEIRAAFERAPAATLRCDLAPVRPVLSFAFRFHTGYRADIPLNQFSGTGHRLTVHVRATPEGRPPVYLTTTKLLPDVPPTDADAEAGGMFIVGEGSYAVDLLVQDERQRTCRSSWQIQARRNGSERQVAPTTRP